MNYPVAIGYEPEYSSYHNREYKYLTPYADHERITKTIQDRLIKVPFKKILTRADGLSVCPFCKSRYAGDQGKCSNMIQWYREVGGYHTYRAEKFVQIGDTHKNKYDSYPKKIEYVSMNKCDEWTKWDLFDSFKEQQEFFDFVSLVESVQVDFPNLLQKFGSSLPPGSLDEYRVKYLEQKSVQYDLQFQSIKQALETIAQKMNAAGYHLSF